MTIEKRKIPLPNPVFTRIRYLDISFCVSLFLRLTAEPESKMISKFSSVRLCLFIALLGSLAPAVRAAEKQQTRIGLVGLDSSHAAAFTKSLNADPPRAGLEGFRVVAAFPGGSPDLPTSADRLATFTKTVSDSGVQIVNSIEELVKLVDAVIINSVDGRVHPAQAKAVIAAGKPVFIDKPLALSVAEGMEIFDFARQHNVPCFSSSSLRYCTELAEWTKGNAVVGCETYSPCSELQFHPDLFFYGIHGIEMMSALMGPGCESVTCARTSGTDVVVGTWKDGRIATFRGIRNGKIGFGATVFGEKRIAGGPAKVNYDLLLIEIVKFFRTGTAPVPPETTLEVLALMEAANASHQQGGIPVRLKTAAKASIK
jgi:Predicted dehydrogenases and related proteins